MLCVAFNESDDEFLKDANVWIPKGSVEEPAPSYRYNIHGGVIGNEVRTDGYSDSDFHQEIGIVKPVLGGHSKLDKTKVLCLSVAGPTVAQLEVFFSSDYL